MSFSSLALSSKILSAIAKKGYKEPSPIQAQAIPAVLSGKDVMAAAQTGTGKTAGFTLPILELLLKGQKAKPNHARVLVLTPTRELAAQVGESVATYGAELPLTSAIVFGGVKINPQMMRLRKGVDILVATPGRLMDLYNQNAVKFSQIEVLVLDEADRMLDMGFIRDIKKIIALLPKQRQNLLFSATFSPDIRALAKGLVHSPVEISINPETTTAETVQQTIIPTDKKKKSKLVSHLIKENNWQQVLIFTRTKHGANKLTKDLESQGIHAAAIHGNKSQGARTKALANFKTGEVRVLVATDIAARGLDIDQLPQVVNFELPNVPEDYVHRIGRTGRAGAKGHAVSLVCSDEINELQDIEHVIQQHLERKIEAGFEPFNALPDSRAIKPLKSGRPQKIKKKKVEHKDGQRSGDNAKGHKPKSKNPRHTDTNKLGNSSAKSGRRKPNPAANSNKKKQSQSADPYSATR
ncbi:MAG: DEAD/DEAH box helicase [Thalassotalea sp.]|nr:DEAD/DEAH box helicase [Thalassotalea sp.]